MVPNAAEVYTEAFDQGLRPDPLLSVSEWADRHRRLSGRASSEPGPWRTSRTPYLREIMDALSPASPIERVVLMKGAQTGGTEAGNNVIGFVIHHAPGPMLAVLPTVEMAKRNSKQRIDPLIEESPVLKQLVRPARSRDSGNTVLAKEFPGGVLVMTGANSAVGLRSMPVRYLFLDEVDGYPGDVDGEGDPVALAEARTRTFSRRKILIVSTPTIKGISRIEREYEASDRRRYFVPCPECGEHQALVFERLRWEKGKPETAANVCAHCDAGIAEHHKTWMLENGAWRPTAECNPRTAGFHISSLYSPVGWRSWAQIAAAWEAAQGSDAAIKSFKNTELGETWVETGEAPDWQRLYDRREAWKAGVVPAGGLFLTAGADVQKDRVEVDVWAWGRGLESWLVDHLVIDGGPERQESWAELNGVLDRTWRHAGGAYLRIAKLAIDTGYDAPAVYGWARSVGFAQVAPVKGVEGFNRSSPVSGPTYVDANDAGKRLRRGARLWTVAVSTFKAETYRFLRLERPTDEDQAEGARFPPGTVHLPRWVEAEWLKQFVAEQLITVRTRRGFARLEWQKMRERNEALDCRVYARAAAWIAGADRWSDARWRDLEEQLGVASDEEATAGVVNRPSPEPTGKRRSEWFGRREGWLG
ncbi:MAG TPA: phage terminase large subunit family protein [Thermohalobaculum sp.]|nr:phage terminase large subunit family protein [Thermohalobaculum sp.]